MEETYRYIVYIANEDKGYYSTYYTEKEHNIISDIVAIFKTEEKAKKYVKDNIKLEYIAVLWEE